MKSTKDRKSALPSPRVLWSGTSFLCAPTNLIPYTYIPAMKRKKNMKKDSPPHRPGSEFAHSTSLANDFHVICDQIKRANGRRDINSSLPKPRAVMKLPSSKEEGERGDEAGCCVESISCFGGGGLAGGGGKIYRFSSPTRYLWKEGERYEK